MLKRLLCALCLYLPLLLPAQYSLKLQVNDFSGNGDVYVMGPFNSWNPGDINYHLTRINYFRSEIILHNLAAGNYAFKFTRGSSQTVETKEDGSDIPNRTIQLRNDTTILLTIQGWKDTDRNTEYYPDSIRLRNALRQGFKFLNTNLDSSYKYALETYSLAGKLSDPRMKAYAINLQGEVLLRFGNTEKALELYQEGLNIRRALNDSASIVYLYNQVGNTYWQLKDTLAAVYNYRQALPWVQDFISMHPLHETLCNIYCNIGRYFLGKNQLDSAKWYAAEAGNVGDKISTNVDQFLGDIARKENNYTSALQYYHSSVQLGIYHDHNLDLVLQSYERIAELFLRRSEKDSTIAYLRMAFKTADTLHNADALSRNGLLLANLFKEQHQYDSAFFYQEKVIESARLQNSQQKERQTLTTYFNEKINQQASIARKKQYQNRIWLYVLLSGLGLLTLFVLVYRIRMRSRYNRKMKEVEMRALRAQMNPHFIFNCLGSINRYIVKSDTRTASNYLTRFAKLIRLILDNSSCDHISLDAEIQTLQLYLDMESLRFDYAFEYEIEKEDGLDESSTQLPSMLIQPYVENAIWHGLLQKEEKGKLWIRFKKMNGHILQAEIEDNGIGRKKAAELRSNEFVKHKSYGMQISSDRINIINHLYQLKNSVTIHDLTDEKGEASGTKIIIQIPVTP